MPQIASPIGPVHTVAVIVQDGAEPFGLGSLVEVWGEPEHPEDETPVFDFRICTPRPGRVKGRSDFDMYVERGLEAAADADLVCVSPHFDFLEARRRRARGAPGGQRPRRDPLRALLGDLRARRGGSARRPRVHDALALHRPPRADVPRGQGQAGRPLLPRRQHPHRRRLGGRHRRVAAPDARPLRRPRGRDGGPPDRRTPAPRRRPGPVHRARRPRLRQRDVRAAAPVDHRPPRRGPRRRHPGPQVADVAAHLRAPVPRRDRRHPALVGDPAAGAARRGAARADRPLGGVDRLRRGLRQRRHAAPPLHPLARREPAAVPPLLQARASPRVAGRGRHLPPRRRLPEGRHRLAAPLPGGVAAVRPRVPQGVPRLGRPRPPRGEAGPRADREAGRAAGGVPPRARPLLRLLLGAPRAARDPAHRRHHARVRRALGRAADDDPGRLRLARRTPGRGLPPPRPGRAHLVGIPDGHAPPRRRGARGPGDPGQPHVQAPDVRRPHPLRPHHGRPRGRRSRARTSSTASTSGSSRPRPWRPCATSSASTSTSRTPPGRSTCLRSPRAPPCPRTPAEPSPSTSPPSTTPFSDASPTSTWPSSGRRRGCS